MGIRFYTVSLLLVAACGREPIDLGATGTSGATSGPNTTTPVTTTTTTSPTSITTTTAPTASDSGPVTDTGPTSDTDSSSDSATTDCPFICDYDIPGGGHMCDVWAQDCPEDEKCLAWANDGGSSWNATKCSPVGPKGLYETCNAPEGPVGGVDNCEVGLMCWDLDDNNNGTCIGLCTGSPENPGCEDPGASCILTGDGVLTLCLPGCDPLMDDCAAGNVCVSNPSGEDFICVLDASGDMGAYGDPCEYVNVCDPGLFCAQAENVPGCIGTLGCCSEFCDLDLGDAQCSGFAQGQVCTPWYEMGMAPQGYEKLGACVLP